MSTITVLLFEPGQAPRFADVEEDCRGFRQLLRTETLDATFFAVVDRFYALWCDDEAVAKKLPPNRRLVGDHKYGDWMMRGPFFVSRVRGECDTSVDGTDLPYVGAFVEGVRLWSCPAASPT